MTQRPVPVGSFAWLREPWGEGLHCSEVDSLASHLFTARPLDMTAPGPWADVVASLGGVPGRVMRVKQVHGNAVRVVSAADPASAVPDERPDGDAIVSNVPGLALAVMVADCVPILLVDRRGGAAAAIHAGWRGTCARVAPAAIVAMQREFGTQPEDLVAAIGPSVGPDEYEVGESLAEAFRDAGHPAASLDRWFRRDRPTPHLDLWCANRDQLLASGLPPAHIHLCGLSTVRHPEVFHSYRVDAGRAGRIAAIIVVPTRRADFTTT